jgi:hypothetical protein
MIIAGHIISMAIYKLTQVITLDNTMSVPCYRNSIAHGKAKIVQYHTVSSQQIFITVKPHNTAVLFIQQTN